MKNKIGIKWDKAIEGYKIDDKLLNRHRFGRKSTAVSALKSLDKKAKEENRPATK